MTTVPHSDRRPPVRPRFALSGRVGDVALWGDGTVAEALRQALTVPPVPVSLSAEERALVESSLSVHLFHSFAARSHPLTIRHLLGGVSPGQVVLDPFVGSGTVLVEAALRGARGLGLDIGELQIRLARFKATPMSASMLQSLLRRAGAVCDASEERVLKRRRPGRTWDDPSHYEPHVYLELCGLREEIELVKSQDAPLHGALLLILSSLVIKLSRQRAESSQEQVSKALAKGQATRWFRQKAQEVVRLHAAFSQRVPATAPRPLCKQGDARAALVSAAGGIASPASVDVVVTSPPYLGVYDYAAHHQRRCAWLEIDPEPALAHEIGARRQAAALPVHDLRERFQRDTDAWLGGVAAALRPGGRAYVIVGDSIVGDQVTDRAARSAAAIIREPPRFIDGAQPILQAAAGAGLQTLATCAVIREDSPHAGLPRREHLLCLERPV